ncbi:DUF397 domain-containing protein [Frankia sp. Cr1]|uniref:DUF397 domain-containing protein n=1 Tax=Frankia sp. Cr1 TaxID=3073931 RepID=UPI002AD4BCA7|nr:DUF397 domain-containing protein [Frankia sp. Cr1]
MSINSAISIRVDAAVETAGRPAPSAPAPAPPWRRSSFSRGAEMTCVDVAFAPGEVAVRDSKDPAGPVLRFSPREWEVFVRGVRNDEFDAPPDR